MVPLLPLALAPLRVTVVVILFLEWLLLLRLGTDVNLVLRRHDRNHGTPERIPETVYHQRAERQRLDYSERIRRAGQTAFCGITFNYEQNPVAFPETLTVSGYQPNLVNRWFNLGEQNVAATSTEINAALSHLTEENSTASRNLSPSRNVPTSVQDGLPSSGPLALLGNAWMVPYGINVIDTESRLDCKSLDDFYIPFEVLQVERKVCRHIIAARPTIIPAGQTRVVPASWKESKRPQPVPGRVLAQARVYLFPHSA
ncbi:hypothetical protein FSHL1_000308 [Fusarium sambucinum]